jgi:hypothetical protein
MEKEISNELSNVTGELVETLSSLTGQQLNTVPFEGSWTAGELGEHLNKSYGVAELLYGPVRKTERDPAEKVKQIKDVFLNYDIKMKSPDFIVPEKKEYDKDSLLNSLHLSINKIKLGAETLNLDETCTAMALPNLGEMTRTEWIYFVIYHTQRHVHQLKDIAGKVKSANH